MINFSGIAKVIAKNGLKAMGMGLGSIIIGAVVDKGTNALEGRNSIPMDASKPKVDPNVVETTANEVTAANTESTESTPEPAEVEVETPTNTEVEA